jgi:hypothetical protein
MTKKVHILGNGDMCHMMPESIRYQREGKLLVCNQPPFEVANVYATIMVDFKMQFALLEGSINLDGYYWVMGNRPKSFCDANPSYYMKHAGHIREFYTTVPKYAGSGDQGATNFNCGHMATHYAATRHRPDEIHMYGFDSIFDHNMRSYTDVVLSSDRTGTNNHRLLDIWRPIWNGLFKEFSDIKFVLYHKHPNAKIKTPKNVEFVTST